MSSNNILSAYFSHSWKPADLPLNLALWERISKYCHLLIDQPVQHMSETAPPWYISRIESLIRRSDVFIACMPAAAAAPDETKPGDWRLRCSPYLLFEIRLAQRANLPRFIIFDRSTGFRPPAQTGPHVRYLPCRMGELVARFERDNQDHAVIDALEEWLTWLGRNVHPVRETDSFHWACLVGGRGSASRRRTIEESVAAAGFHEPIDLTVDCRHDAELAQRARSLSFLVADVSDPEMLPLYTLAHALFVPSIRLHAQGISKTDEHLPAILRGHPAGYQLDLLPVRGGNASREQLTLRAQAVARSATPIVSHDEGRHELQQRGYKKHLVFISHDLKSADRVLIIEICQACRRHGIDFWEYEERNRSGDHWRNNLDEALDRMTHFIPLLSTTYEHSTMCMKELSRANARRSEITILPFLLADRQRPNVELRDHESTHHERLFPEKPAAENAQAVVENILKRIRR